MLSKKELENCQPGPTELDSFQKESITLKHTEEKENEGKMEGGK